MSLVNRFRDTMRKTKDPRMDEATFDVAYTTGFLALDFLNGIVVHVNKDGKQFKYNSLGIIDGCAATFIGRTGCGKSTLVVQIAANIVRQFPGAAIFHDDLEGGTTATRREVLTRFTPEELDGRYIYRNTGITAENFYQRIKAIHDEKLEHYSEYEYDTNLFDTRGNKIFKLTPTVYIVDSLPMLMPEKLTEEEELSGQMSTTSSAKVNTRVVRTIVPMLKAANIILLSINHILDDVNISAFQRTKAQLSYLKQGERLPGGKSFQYLANNMFRLDDDQKLVETKDLGINGAIISLSIVKSRSNKPGTSIPLVLDYDSGFDQTLSLFMLLKNAGKIKAGGAYMSIEGCDVKFFQRDFKNKLNESPELREAFMEQCKIELEKLIDQDREKVVMLGKDISEEILSKMIA